MLFGSRSNKADLARELLLYRIEHDPAAQASGYTASMVRQLPEAQLMGLPESTVIAIVETYHVLRSKDVPPTQALRAIEEHRKRVGSRPGTIPYDLGDYIEYRLGIEHSTAGLPRGHLARCIAAAEHFFDKSDKGEAAHSVKSAVLQERTAELERLMKSLIEYYCQNITDAELLAAHENEIEQWSEVFGARERRHKLAKFKMALQDVERGG